MYYEMFRQMKKMLAQLAHCLEVAEATAKEKSFDPNLFVGFRLAPDQFALARQVQVACDTAKLGASRLTGKEAPVQADTEQTVAELRARIHSVVTYLDGLSAQDFAKTATVTVTTPRWEGKTMTGPDYFLEHVVPNFFFHVTSTYAILRHNGVPVGKRDYLGALTMHAP